jgi:iron complex outermembrane receptor protein
MNRHSLRAILLGASALAAAGPALAQPASPSAVEEVIVTALKRSTNIQETPIAISAVTAESIANSGVQNVADLGATVPGLSFVSGNPSSTRVVIRGINASGEPTVGLYYDETPVTGSIGAGNNAGGSTPQLRLFDVDRVEVLRGPQGTLYGSGSMGGTLRVIYKKPSYKFESAADASLSSTKGAGDLNYEAQGLLNIPLAEDKIALRLIGFYRKAGGYIDNTRLKIDDINDLKTYGGRALLRIEPTENLTIDVAAYLNKTNSNTSSWQPDLGGEYRNDDYVQGTSGDDFKLYSITANYDLGPVTATGTVSYSNRKYDSVGDVTAYIAGMNTPARCQSLYNGGVACNPAQLTAYSAFVTGQLPTALHPQQNMDTFTAELRFSSDYEGPLQWTAGGFYSDRNTKVWNPQVVANPTTGKLLDPEVVATGRKINDTLDQYAAFGELSFDVTEKLQVTAGARYFKYSKDIIGETLVPSILVGARITPPTLVQSDEKGWVLRFNGSYKVTSDIMVYAEASQGFRPGGANQVLGLDAALTPYQSDKLWNYETGIKSAWFDRRLTLNADVFQIDWSDMQVTQRTPNGAFSYIGNAGKARIRGLEVEGALRPMEGLTINGNFSILNAELSENQPLAATGAPNAGLKGDRIPYTAKFQGGLATQYTWPVNDKFNGLARFDLNHVGSSYNEFRPTYVYAAKVPAYTLVNARAGVEAADDNWGAYVFVTNLFDKAAIFSTSAGATSGGRFSRFTAPPRTVGVNLRKTF